MILAVDWTAAFPTSLALALTYSPALPTQWLNDTHKPVNSYLVPFELLMVLRFFHKQNFLSGVRIDHEPKIFGTSIRCKYIYDKLVYAPSISGLKYRAMENPAFASVKVICWNLWTKHPIKKHPTKYCKAVMPSPHKHAGTHISKVRKTNVRQSNRK